jgi:hypothetical protein
MSISVTSIKSLSEIDLEIKNLAAESKHINPPKRGRSPESRSDARAGLIRSAIDLVVGSKTNRPMVEAYRAGCTIFQNSCYICGYKCYQSDGSPYGGVLSPQADHILPHLLGGAGAAGHLLPTHTVCNNIKGQRNVDDYLSDRPEALALVNYFMELYSVEQMPGLHQAVSQLVNETLEEFSAKLTALGKEHDRDVPSYSILRELIEDPEANLPEAVKVQLAADRLILDRKAGILERDKAEVKVRKALRSAGISNPSSIYKLAEGAADA